MNLAGSSKVDLRPCLSICCSSIKFAGVPKASNWRPIVSTINSSCSAMIWKSRARSTVLPETTSLVRQKEKSSKTSSIFHSQLWRVSVVDISWLAKKQFIVTFFNPDENIPFTFYYDAITDKVSDVFEPDHCTLPSDLLIATNNFNIHSSPFLSFLEHSKGTC